MATVQDENFEKIRESIKENGHLLSQIIWIERENMKTLQKLGLVPPPGDRQVNAVDYMSKEQAYAFVAYMMKHYHIRSIHRMEAGNQGVDCFFCRTMDMNDYVGDSLLAAMVEAVKHDKEVNKHG